MKEREGRKEERLAAAEAVAGCGGGRMRSSMGCMAVEGRGGG
uniref:Glucose inhibited division protein A, putative n=1 Tax=Arundo donax TaxID=35708 RepID=A0A0A9FFU2_ARUDO